MADVAIPWGGEELTLHLPADWTLLQVARSELKSAPADWRDRLAAALTSPASGLPLAKLLAARREGKIALILEDVTRHSPTADILDVVLRELRHARIADERIEVVFATGMHPPVTPKQAAGKLGAAGAGLRWRCNPWHDAGAYRYIGEVARTSIQIDRQVAAADLRIVISSVSPHLQAGFGGGYKMLLPGCASLETIRGLHRLGLRRTARQLVGTDERRNAMRTVIDAAGEMIDAGAGRTFAVQCLLDESNQPSLLATGDVLPAQRMLAKQCAVACGVVVPAPADVLVTNAYPRDHDLWQSFKCIANTLWAARPGGVVICLTRCPGGLNGVRPPPWPMNPAWTRRILRLLGPESLGSLVTRILPRLAGDAAFFIRVAAQTLNRNPILLVSPELRRQQARFPGIEIVAEPEEAFARADRILAGGERRVVVFPAGGITFPAPRRSAGEAAPTPYPPG